ncbi:hypothetical protein BGZ95_011676 [Linnemannia exigua]|uniref:FHA domain-containing protein n=1 Tax=Linnemannia exigua TaxID=604196 RepID=A0AAD4DBM0_9FUNG|nr:hypothetical protein BGZ95_011676 [Linnemannia exigua]
MQVHHVTMLVLCLRMWLKPEMTVTIGRQAAGDVLNLAGDDRSVSRRHVVISISKPSLNSVKVRGEHTKLTIRDLNSKSGVCVNGTSIEGGKDIEIVFDDDHLWTTQDKRHVAGRGYGGWADVNIGDKTNFRLERVDWSICSVGLTIQAKVGIVEMAAEMDAKVEESWVRGVSTHVVIGTSKVSQRIFLALAEGGYMVDSTWFKEQLKIFQESWETKGESTARMIELEHPAPTPSGYEDGSIRWAPNFLRRTLFKDYRFISVTGPKCAGGTWSQEEAGGASRLVRECISQTLIPVFLKPDTDVDADPMFSEASRFLKRWVQEVEIGSALAYASTDMYCNPKYLEELPAMVMMSTLASIQVPFSQFDGSVASTQSFVRPTVSRATSNVGYAKDSPLFLEEAEETTTGSFDLSQLMVPPRKSVRKDILSATSAQPPPPPQQTKAEQHVKKKVKTDRMAMFFDGLDDDNDIIEVDPPSEPTAHALPTALSKATRQSSSLQVPVPVAWPDSNSADPHLEQEQDKPLRSSRRSSPDKKQPETSASPSEATKYTATNGKTSTAKGKTRSKLLDAMFEDDDIDEVQSDIVKGSDLSSHDETEATTITTTTIDKKIEDKFKDKIKDKIKEEVFSYPVKESDSLSELSAPSVHGAGKKKKPTSFDVIRDDMVALNLDVKLERQIQFLEEKERSKRLSTTQTKASEATKVMQWERSAELNTKSKRRKMMEEQEKQEKQDQGPTRGQGSKNAAGAGSRSATPEVQILDEADQKDWPERWKRMANFKNISEPSPDLKEKWKNVPNFKAFRKSKLPGVKVEPREPMLLTLDGELVPKQEAAAKKIATYLKREPEVPSVPVPTPRRKVNEKQRERDDLQRLLADD